ncbi:hypothetical protein EAS1808013_000740 [Enterobacter asburiae]|nr:hypothetical protein EAS1808013_000740 [Enterobacter asburiae]
MLLVKIGSLYLDGEGFKKLVTGNLPDDYATHFFAIEVIGDRITLDESILYWRLLIKKHRFLSGRSKRIFFKGVMSFYPLVTNERQLRELDGWLVSTIYRALLLRSKLLAQHGYNRNHSFPFNQSKVNLLTNCSKVNLLTNCSKVKINGKKLLEIPSFLLISKALRKGLIENGIERVMNPNSQNYNYRW